MELLLRGARRGGPRTDARRHRLHVGPDLPQRVRRAERGVLGHHGHLASSSTTSRPAPGYLKADYLLGEDLTTPSGGVPVDGRIPRPTAIRTTTRSATLGTADNGGVHTNSGIANHAFYLAVEGGVNRDVGPRRSQGSARPTARRSRRCSTGPSRSCCRPTPRSRMARAATLQAARDLYGPGSDVERAIEPGVDGRRRELSRPRAQDTRDSSDTLTRPAGCRRRLLAAGARGGDARAPVVQPAGRAAAAGAGAEGRARRSADAGAARPQPQAGHAADGERAGSRPEGAGGEAPSAKKRAPPRTSTVWKGRGFAVVSAGAQLAAPGHTSTADLHGARRGRHAGRGRRRIAGRPGVRGAGRRPRLEEPRDRRRPGGGVDEPDARRSPASLPHPFLFNQYRDGRGHGVGPGARRDHGGVRGLVVLALDAARRHVRCSPGRRTSTSGRTWPPRITVHGVVSLRHGHLHRA